MATPFRDVAERTRRYGAVGADDGAAAVLASPPPGTALPMADDTLLQAAVAETPAHLLLAVIAHLTGDLTLIGRARPHIRSIWEGGVRIPPDLDADIRARAHAVLTTPQPVGLPPITEGVLKTIMSVLVGEDVTDEFVPLLVEQMNFQPAGRFLPQPHRRPRPGYRVAIIGAGMSGIVAAIKLAEAGYEYRIYERSTEVGGVWWSNKYPGVAVDTPSHFYSYSFALNPDWPRYYSTGDVLMAYWKDIAASAGIYEQTHFSTTVKSCTWDEAAQRWTVVANGPDGETTEPYDAVISASGLFTHPEESKLPGLESFQGVAAHTANWDPAIDVAGKRVIQVGTGASGVQAGPIIAKSAAHLTIFQRTPPWVMIRPDRKPGLPTADSFRWGLRHIPYLAQWMRFVTYWTASDGTHKVIVADPAWPKSDTSVNAVSEGWHRMLSGALQAKMQDRPDLLAKMTPNYPVMGKRLLQDSEWTDTLKRDNVDLVTVAVERVVEDGVIDREGRHHKADVLVLATGFAMTRMMQHMDITGRDGVRLRDVWGEEDPRAYLGTMVPGFPNFFLINGPNAGATHGAGVNIYSEAQVHYILACLDTVFDRGATTIEPLQEAHDLYNETVDAALENTVWNHPNVTTYYRNSKGRNFVSNPWRIVDMWHMMRAPETADMVIR